MQNGAKHLEYLGASLRFALHISNVITTLEFAFALKVPLLVSDNRSAEPLDVDQ